MDVVPDDGSPRSKGVRELDRVSLARSVRAFYDPAGDGFATTKQVPVGACGTVLSLLPGADSFDVEFDDPFPALATVHLDEIA